MSRVIPMSPAAGRESGPRPYRVLVVDDVSTDRLMVGTVLSGDGYEVAEAENGRQAVQRLAREAFDAVLLDVMLPDIDGFEVCRRVRQGMGIELLPIILLTSLSEPEHVATGLESGATDFLTKPYSRVELLARVGSSVAKKRLTDRLDHTESVLFALARMVEAKDARTRDHCDRLAHMAVLFGGELGCSYDELEALRRGGVLHDIGKLGIPDAVLLKEGPLDDDEWALMRQHPVIGAQLCSPLDTMKRTLEIVRHHHERQDGGGYPEGLAGDDVPLLARVFQIVDIYDGLSNERPYKDALPREEVVAIMEDETARGYWDPDLVERFLRIVRDEPERLALPDGFALDDSARIVAGIIPSGGMGRTTGE